METANDKFEAKKRRRRLIITVITVLLLALSLDLSRWKQPRTELPREAVRSGSAKRAAALPKADAREAAEAANVPRNTAPPSKGTQPEFTATASANRHQVRAEIPAIDQAPQFHRVGRHNFTTPAPAREQILKSGEAAAEVPHQNVRPAIKAYGVPAEAASVVHSVSNPTPGEASSREPGSNPQQVPLVLNAAAGDANLTTSQTNFDPRRALPVAVVQGQTPLSVGYQKHVEIALTGATAAYSLDPYIVDAGAADGLVQIIGQSPGTTNVVIVTQAGVQNLVVTVPQPPSNLPPGFDPIARVQAGESGIYEFRYNSDPGQITNSLELRRTQGQSFDRFQMVNANLFSAGSSTSAVGFPLLSYEISRPRRDYTFLDQMVVNSPLTLDGYMVRGMHVREGDWQFHGGFTSVATFQGLFLATEREYVAGLSRNFRLDNNNSVQANLFYFRNPPSQQLVSGNGMIGTVAYRYELKDRAHLVTEAGFGNGLAVAARGSFDDEKDHLEGALRVTSPRFASLAVNTQHGAFADVNATRKFNERFYGSLNLNESDFNTPVIRQNTFTSSALLNYKLSRNFSFTGGGNFSRFKAVRPLAPTLTSVSVPAGLDFSLRHFGSGFQYQRVINFDGSGGNDYNVNVRGSLGQFHGSAFFRHDVQVPTVTAIFSQIRGLQDALVRAGITASTPDQIAELLRNTALLESLGFTNPLVVNLATVRNDEGAGLTRMSNGKRHQQVDFNYFNSTAELLQGKQSLSTATVSYAQRLTANDTIVGSAALVNTVNNGVSERRPLFTVSLQHRFYSVPSFILPGRHGVIEGHVFRDDESTALYDGRQPAMAGVEVCLDDERFTHSDANGFYAFRHVPYGVHRVEARLRTDDPFFFTTDSPAESDINNTVNFGINYAKGQLFGFVLNDAGAGVGGTIVELHSDKLTRRMSTAGNGKFSFAGLPAGSYTVSTVPESYPTGYSLQALEPRQVTVEPGKPASAKFSLKALRSIAGRVLIYDRTLLQPAPVAAVVVRLKELSLESTTAANGAYIFRGLPAGTYTLIAEYQGKQVARTVVVPADPATIRDIDLNVGTK